MCRALVAGTALLIAAGALTELDMSCITWKALESIVIHDDQADHSYGRWILRSRAWNDNNRGELLMKAQAGDLSGFRTVIEDTFPGTTTGDKAYRATLLTRMAIVWLKKLINSHKKSLIAIRTRYIPAAKDQAAQAVQAASATAAAALGRMETKLQAKYTQLQTSITERVNEAVKDAVDERASKLDKRRRSMRARSSPSSPR